MPHVSYCVPVVELLLAVNPRIQNVLQDLVVTGAEYATLCKRQDARRRSRNGSFTKMLENLLCR